MKSSFLFPVMLFLSPAIHAQYSSTRSQTTTVIEQVICYTFYDLQTNGSTGNRLLHNSDGTLSAAFAFSPNADNLPTSFPDRGTGYAYYDGVQWNLCANTRIEPARTGSPAIAVTETGKEIILAHTGTEIGMSWRPQKGTGAWTFTHPFGTGNTDFWPRIISGGSNGETLHAIWTGSDGTAIVHGQRGPLFYSRSTNGGVTWQVNRSIIPQLDSSHFIGFASDSYSIDCSGDTVAIAYSGPYFGVGFVKSVNGGLSWTNTTVLPFPVANYQWFSDALTTDTNADGIADTVLIANRDPHILIDHQGMCHVWFSTSRYQDASTSFDGGVFVGGNALYYWNETMAAGHPVSIEQVQDFNGNGHLDLPLSHACFLPYGKYMYGSLIEMPSAGIDASGNLFVAYQAIDELADTAYYSQAHKHIYLITSTDNGQTWSYPFDIVPDTLSGGNGEYQEAAYTSIARFVDQHVYILYQRDLYPGNALGTGCDQANNYGNTSDLIIADVQAGTLGIGSSNQSRDKFHVSQNYPNPSRSSCAIDIQFTQNENFKLTVRDISNRVIYLENRSSPSGKVKITLPTAGWPAGIYFYNVACTEGNVMKKMIVE